MTGLVHDALASFDDYAVDGRLHDVPPHAVYEVSVDGCRAVCKVADHPAADPATEAAVLDYLDTHTDLPVPSILAADDDSFVAARIDDLPDESPVPDSASIDAVYARALGAGLARLHEATAGRFDRLGHPRAGADGRLQVDARDSMHAVARDLLASYESSLTDVGWADPVREVQSLLADRPALLADAGDPLLCHGNFLPDHVGFAATPGTDGGGGQAVEGVR